MLPHLPPWFGEQVVMVEADRSAPGDTGLILTP